MFELIIANLKARPFRTLISIIGVALGVILIVLFTGLADGMTNDMAKRAANWKAEIVFTRPGGMDLNSSNASVSLGYVDRLQKIEGVRSAVPVIRYLMPDSSGRWGIRQIDGLDWEPFAAMNDMKIVEGRPATALDELMLDERQMADDKLKVGDTYEIFGGKPYKIVGVFSPPSGARIKMSLAAMQAAIETRNASYILVKLNDGADTNEVAARINSELPGNKVNITRDLIIDAQERIPGLKTFLRVLIGLGAFVSTIFVMLSMYTTITERSKEIGILKSLGASKAFIIRTIEGEAFLIGILGVVFGLILSFAASFVVGRTFDLAFEFSFYWIAIALAIAVLGSLFGALYPAWKASSIDPVEVMVNE